MAKKRIKMVRYDNLSNKIKLLYDDDSRGELDMAKCRWFIDKPDEHMPELSTLAGLTLKQAKKKLDIKD